MSVLVTYATSKGSTREVAEHIASRLAPLVAPAQVDCKPVQSVPRLSTIAGQYKAVVIGSAMHAGRWIRPGRQFIDRNAAFLSGSHGSKKGAASTPAHGWIPVWAFTVGMPATEEDLAKEEGMVVKAMTKSLGEGTLRGHKLFRGVMNMEDLNWFFRAMIKCCIPEEKRTLGDRRDWEAIEAWTDQVGKAMREEQVVAPTDGGRP